MIVELKYDQSAEGAVAQIHEKKYVESLKEYHGNLLLVGINYDKESKKHVCVIEKFTDVVFRSVQGSESYGKNSSDRYTEF